MTEFDFDKVTGREPISDREKPHYPDKVKEKYNFSGIYCICIDNKVLYVGQSLNMYGRLWDHMKQIRDSAEKKYKILREAQYDGCTITFQPLYYCKRVREDAVKRELNEREGYFINYYLPPLNKRIPAHEKFEKQTNLLNQVNDYKDALALAKELKKAAIPPKQNK